MKRIQHSLWVLGVTILITSCGKKEKNTELSHSESKHETTKISNAWRSFNVNTLKLTSSGIGKFKVGEAFPTQFSPLKSQEKSIIRKEEGGSTAIMTNVITCEGKTLFTVNKKGKTETIDEITLYTPEITTLEKLGVGSSLSEFVAAYPDAKVWYTYVTDAVVLESDALKNMQFILNKADYKNGAISYNSDIEYLSINDFNTDSKIQKIRIF